MFLSQIDLLTSNGLLETLYAYIPNVIAAVIVLVVGWVAGHVVGKIIGRTMDRIGANAAFRRTSVGRAILRAGFTASEFSKAVTKWIIYIAAILVALENLQVPWQTRR
ncbi:MAG: hypothetical protein NXY59_01915 [Aigarchaeota archaeon]|nr:hypothetical protein [Candidatus Pelearchaeum maunauluense]